MDIKEVAARHTGMGKIMAFAKKEEEAANSILAMLEGMTVEEGVTLLEKCIVYHALFGWHREYETAPKEYFSEGS